MIFNKNLVVNNILQFKLSKKKIQIIFGIKKIIKCINTNNAHFKVYVKLRCKITMHIYFNNILKNKLILIN
jgi:hypothetical protein